MCPSDLCPHACSYSQSSRQKFQVELLFHYVVGKYCKGNNCLYLNFGVCFLALGFFVFLMFCNFSKANVAFGFLLLN